MKHLCNSLLLCGIAFLWVPAANAQDITIRRVTDRVITLSMSNLGMHTNVTVIETQKGLVVIETEVTPSIMKRIKKAAEQKLGRNDWAYVINTHGHLHHAGGNSAFPKTPIIGDKTTSGDWLKHALSSYKGRVGHCDYLGVNSAIKLLRQNLAQAKLTAVQKETLRRRLRFCNSIRQEIMAGFEVRNPTITFRERNALDLGDTHLRLTYWGEGISHSSIFVHVVEDNMLVGMGMGGGKGLPSFYGKVTLEGIRHAISVYKELCDKNFPIDIMIGIHSPVLNTSRQRFHHSRTYFQTLLDDLTQAMQNGLSLRQTKDKLSLDKEYAPMRRYFDQPKNISEIHLKNIDAIWELLQKEGSSNSQEQNN